MMWLLRSSGFRRRESKFYQPVAGASNNLEQWRTVTRHSECFVQVIDWRLHWVFASNQMVVLRKFPAIPHSSPKLRVWWATTLFVSVVAKPHSQCGTFQTPKMDHNTINVGLGDPQRIT